MIQSLRILPLLLIRCKPILPKDNVVPHRQREQSRSARCDLSPANLTPFKQTHDHSRPLYLRTRFVRTSHIRLSTNFTPHTVKWKTPFRASTYLIHTAVRRHVRSTI